MNLHDIDLLFAYNRWANARVLEAAALLAPEQATRDLRGSYPSVRETLAHIVWAEWLWLGRWLGSPPAGSSPLECADVATLRERWTEVEREQSKFLDGLTDADLVRRITYENLAGVPWTYSLRHMLQHIVNHSTYHRGQVAAMLRQLGAVPPPTDLLVFMDVTARPVETDRPA